VNVDTTVQEKAIAYPTDARLYEKARRRLVKEAKQEAIELRQSYARLGPRALRMQGQYGHARQVKRAKKETKKLKVMLGRVIRDIRRKAEGSGKELSAKLQESLRIAELINQQQKEDKGKIYSMHAPEVECISKGKVHKKYEFGCKVSVATTSRETKSVSIFKTSSGRSSFLGNTSRGRCARGLGSCARHCKNIAAPSRMAIENRWIRLMKRRDLLIGDYCCLEECRGSDF